MTAGPVALVRNADVMRVAREEEAGSSPVMAALFTRASTLVESLVGGEGLNCVGSAGLEMGVGTGVGV